MKKSKKIKAKTQLNWRILGGRVDLIINVELLTFYDLLSLWNISCRHASKHVWPMCGHQFQWHDEAQGSRSSHVKPALHSHLPPNQLTWIFHRLFFGLVRETHRLRLVLLCYNVSHLVLAFCPSTMWICMNPVMKLHVPQTKAWPAMQSKMISPSAGCLWIYLCFLWNRQGW